MTLTERMSARASAKWDARFLALADTVAAWSKDPNRKVGAVIVDDYRRVVSLGYAGLPRGVSDDPAILNNQELKREMTVHAEENAILFADRERLRGATLYVSHPPCGRCMAKIIQVGIVRVVVGRGEFSDHWQVSLYAARDLAARSGISYEEAPK